eukprot:SAG31_NODE_16483_length_707_cov_1.574013_1_plen_105_part_10
MQCHCEALKASLRRLRKSLCVEIPQNKITRWTESRTFFTLRDKVVSRSIRAAAFVRTNPSTPKRWTIVVFYTIVDAIHGPELLALFPFANILNMWYLWIQTAARG